MKLYDLELYEDCWIVANAEDDGLAIADIEPVDAALIVYAHWKKAFPKCRSDNKYVCSVCGMGTVFWKFPDEEISDSYRYCSWCGARMVKAKTYIPWEAD